MNWLGNEEAFLMKFDDVKSIFFSRIIIRLKVFDGTMMLRHGKSGKTYGILGVSMVFL